MDLNKLTNEEVEQLISSMKKLKKQLNLEHISSLAGKVDQTETVLGVYDDVEYRLKIYRGRVEETRFSIHIRFAKNNIHLLRVDVNGGYHPNPDGTIAPKSHIHIYSSEYPKRDSYAYPIDNEIFPDLSSLVCTLESFLSYTNIIYIT